MMAAMIPFTGRDAERALAAEAVARIGQRRPSALVMVGAAGVGKTRLLRETPTGTLRRLDIVGYEQEQAIPFAAAAGLLAELVGAEALADYRTMAGGGAYDALRIFEATFAAVTAAGPLVLVVDDLQWLDQSSAALVHYVARGALTVGLPVGLLVATRPGPGSGAWLESLERLFGDRDGLVMHQLETLSEGESRALVRSALPAISDARATELWQRVGGSPYWLLALARAATNDPSAVLGERLSRLSADAVSLLGLLAVAARPTDETLAKAAFDWPTERFSSALQEGVRSGLVVEGVDGLRTAHDLIREAVVGGLPVRVQQVHHGHLAAALERAAGGDVQVMAAALGHRIAAGLPALDLALRLATAPDRRLLGSSGLALLSQVIDGSDREARELEPLELAVARLATELGASDTAYERWRRLAEEGAEEIRTEARVAAAGEAFRLGRPAALHELLDGLVERDVDPIVGIEAGALEASSLLWLESRFPAGRALAADVLARARSVAVDRGSARFRTAYRAALKVAFEAAMQAESWPEQIALAEELVEVSRGMDARAHVEALLYDGMAHRYLGDRRTSAERYRRAHVLATREVLPDQIVEAGTFLATILESLGELDEALAVGTASAELAERVGDFSKLRARPRTVVPEIRLSLGPWRDALAAIEADAEGLDPHYRLTLWQIAASAVSRIQRTPAAARVRRLVDDSLADAERAGCPRCRREAQLVNAVSLARVGRRGDARELLDAARSGAPAVALEPYVADMREWAEALLADPVDGPERLATVGEGMRRTGRRIDAMWAMIDLGSALIDHDSVRAATVLRAAGSEALGLGAATQAQVADRLLRGLGQRTWRRGTVGRGRGLTEREREVAALVAAGASNAEVADALFVSVKTVERHVSNLFAKFDVRNRTELARAWAADQDESAEV